MKLDKVTIVETIKRRKNFLLYAIIGVSGVTIDLVVFYILFNFFSVDKNISTIISTSLGITNNFIWNTFFNFKTTDKLFRRFISFYSIGIFGLLLTLLIFLIFVDLLGLNANIVKLFSIVVVVITQYNLNKRISFKA